MSEKNMVEIVNAIHSEHFQERQNARKQCGAQAIMLDDCETEWFDTDDSILKNIVQKHGITFNEYINHVNETDKLPF